METRTVAACDSNGINISAIEEASSLLKAGELVAFPTETVYGLGANALNESAVSRIFVAKGRPANNPLIVHVADIAQARLLTTHWTDEAEALAQAFWPGPLALILKKSAIVPGITTAGGDTVAIRCPDHPVALALIRACAFPLAAPSANKSNAVSPTTAAHVAHTLTGRIPMILDGGPSAAGIESTVINLTGPEPAILRPGIIGANDLAEVLGSPVVLIRPNFSKNIGDPRTTQVSPGQLSVHYAPDTPMYLLPATEIVPLLTKLTAQNQSVGVIALSINLSDTTPATQIVQMPADPVPYARDLYAALHQIDAKSHDVILCESPPDSAAWAAVRDRLIRAAAHLAPSDRSSN